MLQHFRKIVSFLYEANEDGSRGKSSCSFTLQTVYETLVRHNVSSDKELEVIKIDTNYIDIMKHVQRVSRGKKYFHQCNITQ